MFENQIKISLYFWKAARNQPKRINIKKKLKLLFEARFSMV